ncbi:MAG TPA: hypothetical protein VLU25_03500 [Acidobacteriota bacterium]|nr:hypothetical protein [Acidobacteriota bacterium]
MRPNPPIFRTALLLFFISLPGLGRFAAAQPPEPAQARQVLLDALQVHGGAGALARSRALEISGVMRNRGPGGLFSELPFTALESSIASDPQTWNRYAYVANNPLAYVDPSGERKSFTSGDRFFATLKQTGDIKQAQEQARIQAEAEGKGLAIGAILVLINVPDPTDFVVGAAIKGVFSLGRAIKGSRLLTRFIGKSDSVVRGSARLPSQLSRSIIDDVLASSARLKGQTPEGARAIAKKLGRAEREGFTSAFEGIQPTQANAEAIIRETLANPSSVFVGDKVIDVSNAAGQGVRINKATNTFVGFLERGLVQ